MPIVRDATINQMLMFTLREDEGLVVHGIIGDLEIFEDEGYLQGCTMNFQAAFGFNALASGRLQTREFTLSNVVAEGGANEERCAATVFIEVVAN